MRRNILIIVIFELILVLFLNVNCNKVPIKKTTLANITNGQYYLQIKNLNTLSKKLIKRIQVQNEKTSENLNDCYQKLGKYTRLLIANNKKRIAKDFSGGTNKNNKNLQMPFFMHKELYFYLSELEQNYKLISELEAKIKTLNTTRSVKENVIVESNQVESTSKSTIESSLKDQHMFTDCSSIQGNGFIQMKINMNTNVDSSFDRDISSLVDKVTFYCENNWLVIQQRQNGFDTSFNRTWREYSQGFGSLRGDFWIGLDIVSKLTQKQPYELLVELTDWSNEVFVAKYDNFEVGNEEDFYKLSLSGSYNGNASHDFLEDVYYGLSSQNGAYFSTYDHRKFKTNITSSNENVLNHIKLNQRNCALRSGGGWWFNNFITCLPVNLNGIYVTGASAPSARGIKWQAIRPHDRNYALKKSKMKIKPKYRIF